MHTTIRKFQEADLDPVAELSLRAWEPVFDSLAKILGAGLFAAMHPGGWRAAQEQAVRDACTTDGTRVWVAEVDAAAAGFVAARLDERERTGEVHMIAVDPAYQRQGIGARLTSVAVEWMRDSGMQIAMVETGGDPGHAPARRTYERAGFTQLPIARYFRQL